MYVMVDIQLLTENDIKSKRLRENLIKLVEMGFKILIKRHVLDTQKQRFLGP